MLTLAAEFELINGINGPGNAQGRDDFQLLWRATDTERRLQRVVAALLHLDRERRELTALVRAAQACTELATVWQRKGMETAIEQVPSILGTHLLFDEPGLADELVQALRQPRRGNASSRRDALLEAAGRVVGRGLTRMKEVERYLRTGKKRPVKERREHADYLEPLREELALAHRAIHPEFADELDAACHRVLLEALRSRLQTSGA